MNYFISEFVSSELKELESKDPDTLYICIRENLEDMGANLNDDDEEFLYQEIERQLGVYNFAEI